MADQDCLTAEHPSCGRILFQMRERTSWPLEGGPWRSVAPKSLPAWRLVQALGTVLRPVIPHLWCDGLQAKGKLLFTLGSSFGGVSFRYHQAQFLKLS